MTRTTPTDAHYSESELVVSAAARLLAGRATVFAGVGLPILAVDLASRTVNDEIEAIYESGVAGTHPEAMAQSVADPVLVSGAEAVLSMHALFGYVLGGGRVDVGFLGAAQIDRYGSINTSFIGDARRPEVRLPGSGGAADIMANAGEVFVIMRRHDHASFALNLDFITSPSPVAARESTITRRPKGYGVSTVISPLGILRRHHRYDELELTHVHPGVSVDEARARTGWELRVAEAVETTPAPTDEELRLLRDEIDTVRLYLR